ncbi:MAG: PRC-barrel domain-containing protein [Gemmatimonas sp.]
MRVKDRLAVAAAALLFASASAFAQQSSPAPGASVDNQGQLTEIKNDDARAPSLNISRKDLAASSIFGSDGKKIASVNRVLGDNTGNIKAVTADVGRFLGVVSKEVVFPIDQLSKGDEKDHLTTTLTRDAIRKLRPYASSESTRSGSVGNSASSMAPARTAGQPASALMATAVR